MGIPFSQGQLAALLLEKTRQDNTQTPASGHRGPSAPARPSAIGKANAPLASAQDDGAIKRALEDSLVPKLHLGTGLSAQLCCLQPCRFVERDRQ